MLLEVKNLNKKFGSVTAANNINFKMNENEIIGVIGANGAGKTTFCNIITGYLKADSGEILYQGENITKFNVQEIKNIGSTSKRKEMFIKIVLPLIVKENNKIRIDRKRLFAILGKNSNTEIEKKWLEKKYKQYGVRQNDLSTLKIRMDEIPVSLAIAQAAKETGWGTSRFALKGNALFGQWTWSGEGLKPKNAEKGEEHKVMKFHSLQLSVRAYLRNLNTHSSYKNLRKARTKLRNRNKSLDSIVLSNHLDKYAETGNEYIEVLQKIILQNNFSQNMDP